MLDTNDKDVQTLIDAVASRLAARKRGFLPPPVIVLLLIALVVDVVVVYKHTVRNNMLAHIEQSIDKNAAAIRSIDALTRSNDALVKSVGKSVKQLKDGTDKINTSLAHSGDQPAPPRS